MDYLGRDEMLQDIVSISDKIEVSRLDHTGRQIKNATAYISQLLNIIDDEIIHIASPIVYSRLVLLEIGSNYLLNIYSNKGLYQCKCVVLNHLHENNTTIVEVQIISRIEKHQRRQYYRLDCLIDIYIRQITKEELLLEQNGLMNNSNKDEIHKKLQAIEEQWNMATITDISGGGLRIKSDKPLHKGDHIYLKFDLHKGNNMLNYSLKAIVISSFELNNRIRKYEHRVEFQNISRKEREEIIKYIFEQERRRRQKDKL